MDDSKPFSLPLDRMPSRLGWYDQSMEEEMEEEPEVVASLRHSPRGGSSAPMRRPRAASEPSAAASDRSGDRAAAHAGDHAGAARAGISTQRGAAGPSQTEPVSYWARGEDQSGYIIKYI